MALAQSMHMTHITHTWGKVQLQGVTWDSYVRSPTFVAWAMIGSLSRNLFCHLQANGEWLIILESLKEKRKQTMVLLQANPTNNKMI